MLYSSTYQIGEANETVRAAFEFDVSWSMVSLVYETVVSGVSQCLRDRII